MAREQGSRDGNRLQSRTTLVCSWRWWLHGSNDLAIYCVIQWWLAMQYCAERGSVRSRVRSILLLLLLWPSILVFALMFPAVSPPPLAPLHGPARPAAGPPPFAGPGPREVLYYVNRSIKQWPACFLSPSLPSRCRTSSGEGYGLRSVSRAGGRQAWEMVSGVGVAACLDERRY